MPQHRRLVGEFYSMDLFFCFYQLLKNFNRVIKVLARIYPPRNSEPQKFMARSSVFPGLRVPPLHNRADLNATDSALNIERNGKCLSWKLIPRNVRQKLGRVNIDRVSADGKNHRNAQLAERFA